MSATAKQSLEIMAGQVVGMEREMVRLTQELLDKDPSIFVLRDVSVITKALDRLQDAFMTMACRIRC